MKIAAGLPIENMYKCRKKKKGHALLSLIEI
jgi:hypothetical protein